MSEPKWTPGPLLCDDEGFVFKNDALGTTVVLPGDYIHPEERKANARLFAVAQRLYAALEELVALTDRKHVAWDEARSALARARGEA